MKIVLTNPELQLIPATRTQIATCFTNPDLLARQLGTRAAPDWDAEFYCAGAPYVVNDMREEDVGWWYWWITQRAHAEAPIPQLMGFAGFKGPPTPGGNVELTYLLAPSAQGRGRCSASVALLLAWAFLSPKVRRVIATISTDNEASQAVVKRSGLTLREDECDDELLVFGVERTARPRSTGVSR